MKKIMWIVAMIPVVVTSVVLQFMPDIIPMHHDLEGNTDRWGSKTESFIFPAKVSCILCGIIFIVLGNFMTKAKRNAVVGVRTVWSMHNDNTWRKSNRFGAICIIITGLLTIITTVFTSGMTGTIFMLIYLLLATIVTVVYSKKIYDKEIEK